MTPFDFIFRITVWVLVLVYVSYEVLWETAL